MKPSKNHYKTVHIEFVRYSDKLFKIVVSTFFNQDFLAEFYIPRKEGQLPHDIDPEIIKFRLKKECGITFNHNTATYK